jgi:hypothetical protein
MGLQGLSEGKEEEVEDQEEKKKKELLKFN